jgi:hypothetical protein
MKSHHTQAHGESIAWHTLECEICGDEYEVYAWRKDSSRFCSSECRGKNSGRLLGEGEEHPSWNGGKESKECEWCGERYEDYPSTLNEKYCSSTCKWESINDKIPTGEEHPNSKESVELECEFCGKVYLVNPHKKDRSRFCSKKCDAQWRSENLSGENSYEWDGGAVGYYGPSWARQRRKALDRDGHECVMCGESKEDIGREPDVHHKTKFKNFGVERHKEANKLDNLITLCRDCHTFWENLPVQPQLD